MNDRRGEPGVGENGRPVRWWNEPARCRGNPGIGQIARFLERLNENFAATVAKLRFAQRPMVESQNGSVIETKRFRWSVGKKSRMNGNLRVEPDGIERKCAGGLDMPLVLPGNGLRNRTNVRRDEFADQIVELGLVEYAAGQSPDEALGFQAEQRDVDGVRRTAIGKIAVCHDPAGASPPNAGSDAFFR